MWCSILHIHRLHLGTCFALGCRTGFDHYFLTLDVSEILDFCDFLSPTPEEQAGRKEAIESVVSVIKHIWPNCQVCLCDL